MAPLSAPALLALASPFPRWAPLLLLPSLPFHKTPLALGADGGGCSVSFSSPSHGDSMVLQRSPASAAVYGRVRRAFGGGGGDEGADVGVAVDLFDGPIAPDAGSAARTVVAAVSGGGGSGSGSRPFKALLPPMPAGGSYTVRARCGAVGGDLTGGEAILRDVTFGDVWFCAGQSNMALPLKYTTMRNESRDAVLDGEYDSVRIHGMKGNMNAALGWSTAVGAAYAGTFLGFSSTCWYFAEGLVGELREAGEEVPPIGLIHTGRGGSMIEEWLDDETLSRCEDACPRLFEGGLHATRVAPYLDMTVKGWVWYQGENNIVSKCVFGNPLRNSGYACLQVALVKSWREKWSATPGTTDPLAPFGIVALPDSGRISGRDVGTMRWAQTGGYGRLPSPSMPNTFLVQAYDQDDPYTSLHYSCWRSGCCEGVVVEPQDPPVPCAEQDNSFPCDKCGSWCGGFCANYSATRMYMGPYHPRTKRGVGVRLGIAAARTAYGGTKKGPIGGPTLAGCRVEGGKLTLLFNDTLLSGDAVRVQDYDRSNVRLSKMEVLTDPALLCLQWLGERCIDDGYGNTLSNDTKPADSDGAWVPVHISEGGRDGDGGGDKNHEVSAALGDPPSDGGVFGVRYMWQGNCCDGGPGLGEPTDHCPLGSCPVVASPSGLPANPFLARIVRGRCVCVPPQVCDAFPVEGSAPPSGSPSAEPSPRPPDGPSPAPPSAGPAGRPSRRPPAATPSAHASQSALKSTEGQARDDDGGYLWGKLAAFGLALLMALLMCVGSIYHTGESERSEHSESEMVSLKRPSVSPTGHGRDDEVPGENHEMVSLKRPNVSPNTSPSGHSWGVGLPAKNKHRSPFHFLEGH